MDPGAMDTGGSPAAQTTAPAAADVTTAPQAAPSTRAFDVKSLATKASRAIAKTPAYAALLFAALMYLGIKYREYLPPRHGRMAVAAAFSGILYAIAVVSSGDPAVLTRGLSGLMGTAEGTAGLSAVARIKSAWFVVYPAIALGAASIPSLRPWPLVAVVSAAVVLPGVLLPTSS